MSVQQGKRVALITGGNKGIGLETGRQLGKTGITIIVGARTAENGNEAVSKLKAEGIDAEAVLLDVDNLSHHDSVEKHISQKYGKLDILVNNAAINLSETGLVIEAIRKTFETNVFNVIALTQTLLPLVRKSDAGRIVLVSSILGSLTLHSDPNSPIYKMKYAPYNISKTALNAYVVHLAYELKDTAIKVNAGHPGYVKTDMNPYGNITPEEGAKTSVDLATLPADGYTGKLIHLGKEIPW